MKKCGLYVMPCTICDLPGRPREENRSGILHFRPCLASMHCVHACVALLALCRRPAPARVSRAAPAVCVVVRVGRDVARGRRGAYGLNGSAPGRAAWVCHASPYAEGGLFWDASHCFSLALAAGVGNDRCVRVFVCSALRGTGRWGGGQLSWDRGKMGRRHGHTHSASISVCTHDTLSAAVFESAICAKQVPRILFAYLCGRNLPS